jgi:hypothetical protein
MMKKMLNEIHPAVAKHAPVTDADDGHCHVIA